LGLKTSELFFKASNMRLDGWEGTWQGNHYNNPSSREYLAITTSLLEQQSKNQKFLDVGTCEGFYVIHMARKGHWGLGVDLNKKFIKKAREQAKKFNIWNAHFIVASGDALPFKNAWFDITLSAETLEHVKEDKHATFLRELVRVTRKEVILVIPTLKWGKYFKLVDAVHASFSHKDICALVKKNCLEVRKIYAVNIAPIPLKIKKYLPSFITKFQYIIDFSIGKIFPFNFLGCNTVSVCIPKHKGE